MDAWENGGLMCDYWGHQYIKSKKYYEDITKIIRLEKASA